MMTHLRRLATRVATAKNLVVLVDPYLRTSKLPQQKFGRTRMCSDTPSTCTNFRHFGFVAASG
jgi:L-ascorbate metabolism protein UlaG (beta-lactamase superfamily)